MPIGGAARRARSARAARGGARNVAASIASSLLSIPSVLLIVRNPATAILHLSPDVLGEHDPAAAELERRLLHQLLGERPCPIEQLVARKDFGALVRSQFHARSAPCEWRCAPMPKDGYMAGATAGPAGAVSRARATDPRVRRGSSRSACGALGVCRCSTQRVSANSRYYPANRGSFEEACPSPPSGRFGRPPTARWCCRQDAAAVPAQPG